jgi:hypothetical protein
MKKFYYIATAAIVLFLSSFNSVWSQEKSKPELSVGADLVSGYVWRGVYQSGASLQPGIGLDYCGFSIGAWGSTTFDAGGFKELDLAVGYSVAGFSVGVTDYFWAGESTMFFTDYLDSHLFEASLGYDFSELGFPLWLSWNTFLGGNLDRVDGKRKYSTYIEAGYGFAIGSVDMTASVGVAPWSSPAWLVAPNETGTFKRGFQVSAITLGASKSIEVTDDYSIAVFANLVASPARDNAHFVVGISF